ncbi:MAG: hypothetical protein IIZ92_02755, partial [Aquincola sp.]|nr:hypothetical protein [Aquincola sp.]
RRRHRGHRPRGQGKQQHEGAVAGAGGDGHGDPPDTIDINWSSPVSPINVAICKFIFLHLRGSCQYS